MALFFLVVAVVSVVLSLIVTAMYQLNKAIDKSGAGPTGSARNNNQGG